MHAYCSNKGRRDPDAILVLLSFFDLSCRWQSACRVSLALSHWTSPSDMADAAELLSVSSIDVYRRPLNGFIDLASRMATTLSRVRTDLSDADDDEERKSQADANSMICRECNPFKYCQGV